ncbi:MAG: hypothetical protein OXI22_23810 [Defluviicoccus sp.]|nr:hypothetical protein [Defluviicoccus sp.]MDE0386928.1 hypothetical protein [Defluviicoccus sp.]
MAVAVLAGVVSCRIENPLVPQHTPPPAPQEQPLPALPAGGGERAGSAEAASAEPPPPPPEPEPEQAASLDIEPDSLIGLDRNEVRALLGPPSFIRREKPTELWRYRHGTCALALFLYVGATGSDETLRVRHIESWAPGGEQTPPRECLNALARHARQQPTG